MNRAGKIVVIVVGVLTSLGIIGGFLLWAGSLVFAPIAVAADVKKVAGDMSKLEEMVKTLVKSTSQTNEAVRQLATEMKIKRAKEEAVKEERERRKNARALRNPREGEVW